MTVKELSTKLQELIRDGYGDLPVIFNGYLSNETDIQDEVADADVTYSNGDKRVIFLSGKTFEE